MNLGIYSKTVTALIVGAIGWASLVVHSTSGPITADEWIVGATALASAFGVFVVKNAP